MTVKTKPEYYFKSSFDSRYDFESENACDPEYDILYDMLFISLDGIRTLDLNIHFLFIYFVENGTMNPSKENWLNFILRKPNQEFSRETDDEITKYQGEYRLGDLMVTVDGEINKIWNNDFFGFTSIYRYGCTLIPNKI
ncbi:MAG: hypothetical protein ACW99Q_17045 [Candidatus Kariarchaeaceae archaeon]